MTLIRPASANDAAAIRQVHVRAFPTAAEADLVEQLLADGDAEISMVADQDGRIVGHILLSRMHVDGDGRAIRALGLAPVAIIPERQGEGIGSQLINAGIQAAFAEGAEMMFLVGEPEFYRRFGFEAATAKPFQSPYAGKYFQAKVLSDSFTLPDSGHADYAPAFAELE